MTLIEMRTAKITHKGQIAIPRDVRRVEGFKEGSKIAIIAFKDHIELRPIEQISENMLPALISEEVLAEIWDTPEEDEVWKDL